MPGMNGMGPQGMGAQTGFGRGRCQNTNRRNSRNGGYGCGMGRHAGRGMGFCRFAGMTEREALTNVRASLQERLADIDKRLQSL